MNFEPRRLSKEEADNVKVMAKELFKRQPAMVLIPITYVLVSLIVLGLLTTLMGELRAVSFQYAGIWGSAAINTVGATLVLFAAITCVSSFPVICALTVYTVDHSLSPKQFFAEMSTAFSGTLVIRRLGMYNDPVLKGLAVFLLILGFATAVAGGVEAISTRKDVTLASVAYESFTKITWFSYALLVVNVNFGAMICTFMNVPYKIGEDTARLAAQYNPWVSRKENMFILILGVGFIAYLIIPAPYGNALVFSIAVAVMSLTASNVYIWPVAYREIFFGHGKNVPVKQKQKAYSGVLQPIPVRS